MAVWSEIKNSDILIPSRIDAEYYKPEYLLINDMLSKNQKIAYYCSSLIHPSEFTRIYSESGYAVLRAQNIRNIIIDDSDLLFLNYHIAKELKKNILIFGDILITRTGANFGQTALYTGESDNTIVTSHTLILRTNGLVDPAFLTVYLNTWYGRKLLDQIMYGSSQPEITPRFVKQIPLPHFIIEGSISKSVYKAINLYKESKSLYSQAQTLLEKKLGIDKIRFSLNTSHQSNFNEIVTFNRSDADYYQTKYRQLESFLSTLHIKQVFQIAHLEKGIEVGSSFYSLDGKLFIRVSNLDKFGIIQTGSDKFISGKLYTTLESYSPNIDDILLSKDGTPGICLHINDAVEGIISGGIVKLLLFDNDIPKEYLALVINSKICQMQIDRDCSGALILHWKPEQIRQLKIPVLEINFMNKLADLVINSKAAKKESEQLLSSAIKQVEDLIEKESNNN